MAIGLIENHPLRYISRNVLLDRHYIEASRSWDNLALVPGESHILLQQNVSKRDFLIFPGCVFRLKLTQQCLPTCSMSKSWRVFSQLSVHIFGFVRTNRALRNHWLIIVATQIAGCLGQKSPHGFRQTQKFVGISLVQLASIRRCQQIQQKQLQRQSQSRCLEL